MRVAELDVPPEVRIDQMRAYLEALLARAEDPTSEEAHQRLKAAVRSEYSRTLRLSSMVRRNALLRDAMFEVLGKELPGLPKTTLKFAIDSIVDRSIEGCVTIVEDFMELQNSLSKWLLASCGGEPAPVDSFSRFCANAMEFFDVDFSALFTLDKQKSELVCECCSARGVALSKGARVQLASFPLAGEALSSGRTALLSQGKSKSHEKKRVLGHISFGQCMCVPLSRGEEVIGMMVLGDTSKRIPFTPEDVSIAEDVAKHVVRVLASSDVFQKLSIRSRAQRVLIETAAQLQQEIESEEIYRIVGTRLAELVPSDEFAFYVYDWTRRVGNPAYATGPYAAEVMADRDFPADIGIAGYVAKTRRAEIVANTETDPRGAHIPGTPQTPTTMLAVPVIGKKDVLGVIELLRYPPKTFTQEDLEIATMFANHASVAIENAMLLKEVVRVRDQIELSIDLMTHDIANYATPISAYLDELMRRSDLDSQVLSMIDRTSKQVESMLRLVEMVRTLSRLREAGPPKLRRMDLRKAIDQCASEVRAKTRMKTVEFDMYLPGESMFVMADDLLSDMFTNLFYSAAMVDRAEHTVLTVTAEKKKDKKLEYWWVKVAQPNKQIPDNLKGEVLRFARKSKSELAGGFGIGLAAARGIVSRYSGSMWVSDIVQGDSSKGCVFNILLPIAV
ncbi:MAG: GAF domain-containing sensor histidine kinase [Thermoplasmata archaeon]